MMKYVYNHACSRCKLAESQSEGEIICVPGSGDWRKRVLILGEAPGQNEARGGKPFIGQAGQILDLALEKAGLDREQVFVSNTVHCHPPKNRKPTEEEEAACRIYLLRELSIIRPVAILTLGNHAPASNHRRMGYHRISG